MLEDLHEECGVFGIFGDDDAAQKTYLGLYALQHRGQESSGIATTDGSSLHHHRGIGLVHAAFDDGAIEKLHGFAAIGHNRYSTKGASELRNAQPIVIQCKVGQLASAHNGNLVNATELRAKLEAEGSIFQTTADSEIVLHLIARSHCETLEDMIAESVTQLVGAYCFVFLTPEKLIAVRDPYGFRPLSLGKLDEAYVVASETCALDIIDAEYIRSIEPGEMLTITRQGVKSRRLAPAPRISQCIFEHVYFSRPDSLIFGEKVDKVRRFCGRQLARETPCEVERVIAVPDSANTAALGYARECGARFEIGLIRNHYIGRTFIAPQQKKRSQDVKVKFNPVQGVLKDKNVVMVDDSIVRGTTLKNLIRLVKDAGAHEVHVRISSPPVKYPCFYGIDIADRGQLIAASHTVEEIRDFLGADSLAYLSVEGLLASVDNPSNYCTACFTGEYPTEVPSDCSKDQFDRSCRGGGM